MEHALEAHRLTGLDAERNDVLDLEVDRVSDPDAVANAIVLDIDRGPFDAEQLAHKRRKAGHRTAELAGEHLDELVSLLLGTLGVIDVLT